MRLKLLKLANTAALGLAVFAFAALFHSQAAAAGAFVNLDFEQATVVVNDPMFGNLNGNLALPGWVPRSGNPNTNYVYYHSGHFGFAPYIMLLDNTPLSQDPAIAGNYSLYIRGSYTPEFGEVLLRQTGDIPASAKAIELLVDGNKPNVYIGNDLIPLVVVAQTSKGMIYAGNIVSHAGTTDDLRIGYPAGDGNFDEEGDSYKGAIDNIQFTTRVVVPEPATYALAAIGVVGLLAFRRRQRN
jgi:hypothetical protein